ncbi:myelin-associated glycoprotein-like isoform X2 [Triplophysa dalaica]|uniref:myelin-associated glycoprotein-like isoform X2 n=1 Tax=Triplophysa dalaica TaxID=1582913 RepID=UPI0024DF7744|nr:myelin-associated glycoprotein-like isoform X2 [Triplophysa dalaica]
MVVFQSCLFAFILYLRAYSASDDNWHATVPKSVVGLSGSCVVIPCTYNYPSNGKTYTDLRGIWYKGDSDIIYHTDTSEIISKFKDRTSLIGSLNQKNCTLKISSLQHDDQGEYMFRIEIKDLDMYSYQQSKVSITVKDSPEVPRISVDEEVTSQKEVTATCVVSHSCPSDPPRLTWSHKGKTTSDSQPKEDAQLKLTSSLTFTPSREDHNKPLSCSAEFTPAKTVSNNKKLKVKYRPYNVNVRSSPVKENESIGLTCFTDSNPPAHSFQWFGSTGSPLANGSTYRLNNVTRYTEAISCTATNTEGKNSSGPQRINVLYPPYNVNVRSSPVKENESVELNCSSDSNPPAHNFQWFGSTGSQLANGSSYSLNYVTRYTEAISCSATNTEGKNSSGPQRINVLYPPEIKSGSSCVSETFIVCVCIVDSNPPSEVKWLGPSSTFPSSGVERNGSLTIFTLQGWLGFPYTVNCSASNSEGNSVMTLSVPHNGLIIYLVVASIVVVVIVVVISACVAKRHCGRRPAQSVLDVKNDHNELKTTPKSDTSSQEQQNVDLYTNYQEIDQPVYKNFECEDGNPSCEQDEDEAIYANT